MAAISGRSLRETRPVHQPLDAKQAVQSAFAYFKKLFGNNLSVADAALEEVEKTKDGKYWLITLGYDEERRKNANLPSFLRVPLRKFKVFTVNTDTGEVLSMKNRTEG